jgi:hypothetical protein
MAKNLGDAFKEIEKQSKQMAINSMKTVAQKAHKLALKKALSCLKQYYKNYKPKRYKRSNSLKNAIKTYSPKESIRGTTHNVSFSVVYDSRYLNGLYHSNSWYHQSGNTWKPVVLTWAPDNLVKQYANDEWYKGMRNDYGQDNGVPEAGWILNNYLQGVHPWAKTDNESTGTMMKKFFQEDLPNKVGDLIYEEMQDAITGFLKTYGGGK